jgi:hypothetical protein
MHPHAKSTHARVNLGMASSLHVSSACQHGSSMMPTRIREQAMSDATPCLVQLLPVPARVTAQSRSTTHDVDLNDGQCTLASSKLPTPVTHAATTADARCILRSTLAQLRYDDRSTDLARHIATRACDGQHTSLCTTPQLIAGAHRVGQSVNSNHRRCKLGYASGKLGSAREQGRSTFGSARNNVVTTVLIPTIRRRSPKGIGQCFVML